MGSAVGPGGGVGAVGSGGLRHADTPNVASAAPSAIRAERDRRAALGTAGVIRTPSSVAQNGHAVSLDDTCR
jgi:hypothetical protein